jgi:pilus assembly protein CpaD
MPLRRTALLAVAAPLIMGLSLAACATDGAGPDKAAGPDRRAATPTEQWASRVQVVAQPDSIRLGVHADGPSANQAAALSEFVDRWMQAEAREIDVQAPIGASPRMIAGIYQLLTAEGAPASAVKLSSYDPAGQAGAPVVVGFDRYQAIPPKCGLEWESLTRTAANEPYSNFGCAVTANMAAQIANPEDLLRPRGETPVDAQRRATVLDKYRKGETTSSARDEQAAGAVSKAVN